MEQDHIQIDESLSETQEAKFRNIIELLQSNRIANDDEIDTIDCNYLINFEEMKSILLSRNEHLNIIDN